MRTTSCLSPIFSRLIAYALFLGIPVVVPSSAHAFKVTPMVATFAPEGRDATLSFQMTNTTKEPIAVEVESTTRSHDSSGKELRQPTRDFLIYPLQTTLKPGEQRNVRVTWKGDRKLSRERAFRLIFRQLPVDLQQKKPATSGAQINFMFEYVAAVYVTPDNTDPALSAGTVTLSPVSASHTVGKKTLRIILRNTGTAHALLNDYRIQLQQKKASWTIPDTLMEEIGSNNFLPGDSWSIQVTPPEGLFAEERTSGPITVRLDKK